MKYYICIEFENRIRTKRPTAKASGREVVSKRAREKEDSKQVSVREARPLAKTEKGGVIKKEKY